MYLDKMSSVLINDYNFYLLINIQSIDIKIKIGK